MSSIPHKRKKPTKAKSKSGVGTTEAAFIKPIRRHVDEYSEVMRNESSTDKCLTSFVPKPKRLRIDIQAADENIILLVRQHFITQVKWILAGAGMLLLPILFLATGIFSFMPESYQFAGLLGWLLLTSGFCIESFLKWFYRVNIITDERIIDVDFISMVYKDVSTTKIDKIEDVTSISSGFLSSMFDYGTVIVQTAATKQEIIFESVPQPAKITALLNEMIIEEELEKYEGRVN